MKIHHAFYFISVVILCLTARLGTAADIPSGAELESPSDRIAQIFNEYRLDAHIPGLVYGVVMDNRLVHVRAIGVQDLEMQRPVTDETLFRIASMTKSFTALSILKLRDEGRISLDAPVEAYVPEIGKWSYPTRDSPRIRVRDLLTHASGFVTDDPWGDRQTPMPEADFTGLLQEGVPFTRAPGISMEYSNLGYAILGRVIANVTGSAYKDYVQRTILEPLGMKASGYDIEAAPGERRALGYRWEDESWHEEPALPYGAFSAMGGLQTNATDYAKYVAWLLSAWPPRDDMETGPVKRASVRELAQGANFPQVSQRPGKSSKYPCTQVRTYGMGWSVVVDCDLGMGMTHGGGYPGYGSYVLLLPQYGVGIFAFANRTYSGPSAPVWDSALVLQDAGLLKMEDPKVSDSLAQAYKVVGSIYASGSVASATEMLAMNFLLDRSAEAWARELARLKSQVGDCETNSPVAPTGALSGSFIWRCEHGRLEGSVLLAPTRQNLIQSLELTRITP